MQDSQEIQIAQGLQDWIEGCKCRGQRCWTLLRVHGSLLKQLRI